MPSTEPNKDMDDLLRAYASRRREQAQQELPSELHPASRAVLQGEVRRVFGQPGPAPAGRRMWRWMASPWPGILLGGGLAAVLILVAGPNANRSPVTTMETFSTLSSTPAAETLFKRKMGQQFVQTYTAPQTQSGATLPASVLASFQVERKGADVLVYDADGSVYRGQVLEPAAAATEGRARAPRSRFADTANVDKVLDLSANYSFKVSGMNNGSKQNVVFIGSVSQIQQPAAEPVAATLKPGAPAFGRGASAQSANVVAANRINGQTAELNSQVHASDVAGAVQSQLPQIPFVTGRVQVGGGGEFEIQARPPQP